MDYAQLLAMHKGIIYLFLASITFKVALLLVNKKTFQVVRDKTKIVEMILGTLILISGVMLFLKSSATSEAWLHTKIMLGLLGIPLAIIGFRRKSALLAGGALILFIYVFYMGISKGFFA